MSQSIIEKLQADNLALTAENAALKARTPVAYSYRYAGCQTCEGFQDWRWELSTERPPVWMLDTGKVTHLVELFECHEIPATDAAITELYACGVDLFAERCMKMADGAEQLQYPTTGARWRVSASAAKEFAANLRAGIK
jgi:hypothetical protein